MTEKLSRRGRYPLGDRITLKEGKDFGLDRSERMRLNLGWEKNPKVVAVWTGDKRPPRAGEWYLSGSLITAYRALNDLITPYHIAVLKSTMGKKIEKVEITLECEECHRREIATITKEKGKKTLSFPEIHKFLEEKNMDFSMHYCPERQERTGFANNH